MDDLDAKHVETLGATPFARFLASAFDRRVHGTLVLQEPTGEKHALYLEDGAPAKTYLAPQRAPLDELSTAEGGAGVEARVVWLADLSPATRFFCFEGKDYLSQLASRERAREHALALLWRVVRDQRQLADVHATLSELGERHFFLDHTTPLEAFRFGAEDNAAVHALKHGNHQLESVLSAEVLPQERMERLLYLFSLTGWLVSIAPEALFPAPVTSIPPEPGERSATRLAPESHVRELRGGNASRANPPLPPNAFASDAVTRAETLLSQGNLAGARREAALGLEAEPERADLLALHSWLLAQKPGENLQPLWTRLDLLVRRAPDNVRAHFYRGLLLKKMGKHASALQEFREVVERDPHHIDAAREVFLYEKNRDHWLRATNGSGSGTFEKSSSGGILKRWLGRRG